MTNTVNNVEWVEGWRRSYSSSLMAKFRSIFFDLAFFDYVRDKAALTLDVGCGTGFFIRRLVAQGYVNARGIEPDERLVPDDLRDRIQIGSATALPYADQSFDCVYFFNVVHHLESVDDYGVAMSSADRCLKPGGLLVFLEPNMRWFYVLEAFVSRHLGRVWPFAKGLSDALEAEWDTLMYFFDHQGSLRANLVKMGYEIVRERHLGHQWVLVGRKPSH
jgi:SAM-dependent methyltransferase